MIPNSEGVKSLLLLLLVAASVCCSASSSLLACNTARASLSVWGVDVEVNVLLSINAYKEGRNVDELLSNADVSLLDEDASVVDGLGQSLLEDLGLQAALEELLGGQLEDVIQLLLLLVKKTVTRHTAKKSLSLEKSLWVLRVKGEEDTSGLTDLGKSKLYAPDLALASQAILTAELELLVKTFLLERTLGGSVCRRVVSVS